MNFEQNLNKIKMHDLIRNNDKLYTNKYKITGITPDTKQKFKYQYYNLDNYRSTLVKSLLNNETNILINNIYDWIKKNLYRINIILGNKVSNATLNFLESYLLSKYNQK